MNREQFDNTFSLFQLSEIIHFHQSTSQVKKLLRTFSCKRNRDLEDFLHNRSLTFEKHLRSRTYLYIDNETKEVAAYFTIAISMLYADNISEKTIKLLDSYKDDVKTIPCFLIGQLGKSDKYEKFKIGEYILERDFYASYPDEKWVGDITYIPTNEDWLYLATVIDLYSRRIVGWSMDDNMKTPLVNDALNMALISRKPPKGLIWHTDRGSQYASYSHRDLLELHGIKQSMSRKGNCWDNAVAESFFHTLKTELVYHETYETKAQANQSIFEWIEVYYNRQRMHSANNNLSPVEFEEKMMLQLGTAA